MRVGTLEIGDSAVLAPMAGVTDLAFRKIARELGCGLTYTEFVSADGIVRGGPGSFQLLRTAEWDRPLGVQIFGSDTAILAEAARIAYEKTRCDILDLNMGCWVPKVVRRGAGAALLKNPRHVEAIVKAVAAAIPIPVTAKIRAGFSADALNFVEVGQAIEQGGAQAVTLHARVRSQAHNGDPLWDLIGQLKAAVKIPVMGNGGVLTAGDVLAMKKQTGCDAVMIGRAALSQPWIFRQVRELERGEKPWVPSGAERMEIVRRHLAYAVDMNEGWQTRSSKKKGFSSEQHAVLKMRGMLVQYSNGIPGASEFRRTLNGLDSVERALAGLAKVFERADEWKAPRGFAESDDAEESCAA
ncbi:MAG TPA: tRNA dihydrouridine synthase DusB [bacterium]|nr:tRNA dihydrouridine synthase DusB [bacterium]